MTLRDSTPLDTLERWMQEVVMHPEGAERGVKSRKARRLLPIAAKELRAVVQPSKALSSVERLDIYAHMYYARLLEILDAEYPTTRQILGAEQFARAGRDFLRRNPSRHRTLNQLSVKFPAFLARWLPRGHKGGLAVDVARIERAMEDVFDEKRAEPLTAAEFAAIGPEQWGRTRLRVNPALRFLKLRYPANDYMNALRARGRPRVPRPRAGGVHVIVFRRGFQVYRRDQDPAQFKLLQALAARQTLGRAVRAALARRRGSADQFAATLGGWFREWAANAIFCRH